MNDCGWLWIGFHQVSSVDGDQSAYCCVDGHHYLVLLDDGFSACEEISVTPVGDCDDSCQMRDRRDEIVSEFGSAISCKMSRLECRMVSSWYAKRNGHGRSYLLADGRLLVIREYFSQESFFDPSTINVEFRDGDASDLSWANAKLQDEIFLKDLWQKIQDCQIFSQQWSA